jgi:hypothetical protein
LRCVMSGDLEQVIDAAGVERGEWIAGALA